MTDAELPIQKAKKPSLRARLAPRVAEAVEIYGRFDPRSMGLARIGLGLLLIWDLLRRVPDLSNWYSNEGLLPNHTVLWRPSSDYMFSFFFAASRPSEVAVMFVLSGIVFLIFTLGYRTRFFHILSFACMVSLHDREIFTENGGDCALNILCAWTLFLPLGARFSIDAVRKSLARRRERTAEELNDRAGAAVKPPYTASIAFFAVLLQLAVIYYFNAVNKHGMTWHRGTAVRYVLYQERMVTWLGLLVRDHIGFNLSRFLTYTTLGLEFVAPVLLLTPFAWQWSRRFAVIALPLLHVGFAAGLNLGQFSFNMIGYFPLLLSADDWAWLARHLAPGQGRARTVLVREDAPLAFAWARVLARLDAFGRLRFAHLDEGEGQAGTWQVLDPANGRRTSGARAFADCLAALPAGLPLAVVLGLPVVRSLADITGRWIAARESTFARWLRLGIPTQASVAREPSPSRAWLLRRAAILREVSIVVLIVASTSQLLVENHAVPQRLKLPQPKWITQLVVYPRLLQGWQMFSADVPTGERMLYVDAVTFGGRHVDPFNEAGSRVATLPVDKIPPHMEQDEFWCDYTNRIPENEAYWRALKEWIFAYHLRTGRPEDRVISFEAKLIEGESPAFGETQSKNWKTRVMLSARE
jgi:hypothetical protein